MSKSTIFYVAGLIIYIYTHIHTHTCVCVCVCVRGVGGLVCVWKCLWDLCANMMFLARISVISVIKITSEFRRFKKLTLHSLSCHVTTMPQMSLPFSVNARKI